jgi:hypothetical protein
MDLYSGLEDFFTKYNARKHPATVMVPDQHYEASLVQGGFRTFRIRRRNDILPLLAPTAKFKTRSVDSARGLYVNYRWYGHPSLAKLSLEGAELDVKIVPWDPSVILCFNDGEWVVCRSAWTTDMHQLPEYVRACIFEEWLIEMLRVRSSHAESHTEVRKLMDRLNEAAKANRDYWSDPEAEQALEFALDSKPEPVQPNDEASNGDIGSKAEDAFMALIQRETEALLAAGEYGAEV